MNFWWTSLQWITITSRRRWKKNELKKLFKLPKEIEDFINIPRKLTPNDKSKECKIKDPTTNKWYEIRKKDEPLPSISTSLMKWWINYKRSKRQ